jgi:hypothetical protein
VISMKNRVCTTLVSATIALTPTLAWSYDIDLGPLGHACDTCGGGVVGGLPIVGHAINEGQAQASGAALQQWFNASRNTAIQGALPIPPQIRDALIRAGFNDQDAMNRARYRIQDAGALNLAHIIQQWRLRDVTAVTLIDVIVFRGPTEAADAALWAHELTHVAQFRNWGVRDFAISYMRDSGSVEDPAYAVENYYRPLIQYNIGNWPQPQPQLQQPQQQLGAYCWNSQFGRLGPGPLQPIGSPCQMNTFQGPSPGRIVQ